MTDEERAESAGEQAYEEGAPWETVLSIIAIALLLPVLVVSVGNSVRPRQPSAQQAPTRAGADGAQYERSVRNRAVARQAHLDSKEHAAGDG